MSNESRSSTTLKQMSERACNFVLTVLCASLDGITEAAQTMNPSMTMAHTIGRHIMEWCHPAIPLCLCVRIILAHKSRMEKETLHLIVALVDTNYTQ